MREYIYISDAKLASLSHMLPSRSLDRLRELNVSLGPVGGGVALGDAGAPTQHDVIQAIEDGIREKRDVAAPTARHLAPGDWISADRVRGSYGAWRTYYGATAAVFVADLGETGVILSGSTDHLLHGVHTVPGVVQDDGPSGPASGASEIGRLLFAAAGEAEGDQHLGDWESAAAPAFININGRLRRFMPPQPMSFLARLTHVMADDTGTPRRIVVGTPLYVAFG